MVSENADSASASPDKLPTALTCWRGLFPGLTVRSQSLADAAAPELRATLFGRDGSRAGPPVGQSDIRREGLPRLVLRRVRRSRPEAAWRGKTRDLRLPGLYPLLWATSQERNLHRMADHREEANGREAQSHQG